MKTYKLDQEVNIINSSSLAEIDISIELRVDAVVADETRPFRVSDETVQARLVTFDGPRAGGHVLFQTVEEVQDLGSLFFGEHVDSSRF